MKVKMDCKEVKYMMRNYVGGTFEGEAKVNINNHFSMCESCRKEFDSFSDIWDQLAAVREIEPSTGFISRLNEKIEKKRRKPFFSSIPGKMIPVAAMLLLIIVLFKNSGEKELNTAEIAMLEYDLEMIDNIELLMVIEDMEELDLIENI